MHDDVSNQNPNLSSKTKMNLREKTSETTVNTTESTGSYRLEDRKDKSLNALAAAAELDQRGQDNTCVQERSSTSFSGMPFAPFLNPRDADSSFYNEIYLYLKDRSFPNGCSGTKKKAIARRCLNYHINEKGTLSCGSLKCPKDVVTSPYEQRSLLESTHISKKTGSHKKANRMYDDIYSKYCWRTLFVDIDKYVRDCAGCKGIAPEEQNTAACMTSAKPWDKVELHICGPYTATSKGHEYIAVLVDPFTKWMHTKPLLENDREIACIDFIFDLFFLVGFTRCEVYGLSEESFKKVNSKYKLRVENFSDILKYHVPKDDEVSDLDINLDYGGKEEGKWVVKFFDDFCRDCKSSWDENLLKHVLRQNVTSIESAVFSPFNLMFYRNPLESWGTDRLAEPKKCGDVSYQGVPRTRRCLRSSTLQCRHCDESFTSKISFRIHQRKHTLEARQRGLLDGEDRSNQGKLGVSLLNQDSNSRHPLQARKREHFNDGRNKHRKKAACRKSMCKNAHSNKCSQQCWSENKCSESSTVRDYQIKRSTVRAVKSLLLATKEERCKRGKYYRYSEELKDAIAEYALKNGVLKATEHWGAKLGTTVSESTVRNFMRYHRKFKKQTREEIGRYAFHNGVVKAMERFTNKLGFDVSRGLVLNFQDRYAKKLYSEKKKKAEATDETTRRKATRQKHLFSAQTKDEIGQYAAMHGVQSAVQHFSIKLQFNVMKATVRKYKKMFLDKTALSDVHHMANTSINVHSSQDNQPAIPAVAGHGPMSNSDSYSYQYPYSLNVPNGDHNLLSGNSLPLQQLDIGHQNPAVYQQSSFPTPVITNHITFQQNYAIEVDPSLPDAQNQVLTTAVSETPLQPQTSSHHANLAMGQRCHFDTPPACVSSASAGNVQLGAPSYDHKVRSHLSHGCLSTNVGLSVDSVGQLQAENELLSSNKNHLGERNHSGVYNGAVDFPRINCNPKSIGNISTIGHSGICNGAADSPRFNCNLKSIGNISTIGLTYLSGRSNDERDSSQALEISSNVPTCANPQVEVETEETVNKKAHSDSVVEVPFKRKNCTKSHTFSLHSKPRFQKKEDNYTCGKRGNYVSYSPELRAQVGKYAQEHGNLRAMKHFKDKLGMEIPESTIRGLKIKYLTRKLKGEKDVKCLGFAQRGRPMRLGKYDAVVQDCIKELIKEGEKISSFLVIATAKQVLMQYEPSMLEENGGTVSLNPTWAKSFLKRIGHSL